MSHVELSLKGVLEVLVCEYAQIGVGGGGGGGVDTFSEFAAHRKNESTAAHKKNESIGTLHAASFSEDEQHSRRYIMSANAFSSTMGLGNLVTSRS